MRINTGIKLGGSTKSTPQPTQQKPNQWADALPGILGTAGQIGGGILGTGSGVAAGAAIPGADLTGVPEVAGGVMGERAGQTIGGSGGQMIGDALRQLIEGQGNNMDAGSLLSNAGQGALYAQVPGGKMAADIANPLVRTIAKAGIRGAGGAGVSAGTQGIRNIQQGKPLTQDMGGQAVMGGALNTVLPGMAEGAGLLGKGVQAVGKKAGEMGQRIIKGEALAGPKAAQQILGGQIIQTGGEGGSIMPRIQALFDKYNYKPPPEGDIQDTKGFLDRASQDTENKLQPILKAEGAKGTEVSSLINKNLETFYGTTNKGSRNKVIPLQIKTYLNKLTGNQMNLSKLKDFQRGLKDYGNWTSDTKTDTEKFANGLYRDVGNLIETKLKGAKLPKGWDATAYNELQQQHQDIVKMRDSFEPYMQGKQVPIEAMSKEIGKQKMLGGVLSQERALQIALASALGVTNLAPGMQGHPLIKGGLDAAELAMLGPAAFPQSGGAIDKVFGGVGKGMQAPSGNKTVMDLLSQLGVRLPSAGQ